MRISRIASRRERDDFSLLGGRLTMDKIYQIAGKSGLMILMAMLVLIFSLGFPALGQDYPEDCSIPCRADDVVITDAYLGGDFDPCDYQPGDNVSVDVNITVYNRAADRYCLYVWADLIDLNDPSKILKSAS